MNAGFEKICKKKEVRFIDAGKWNIPLAFDLAHFSEEGHGIFAERILEKIR